MNLFLEIVSLLGPDVVFRTSRLGKPAATSGLPVCLPDVVVEPTCTEQVSPAASPTNGRFGHCTGAGYGYVAGAFLKGELSFLGQDEPPRSQPQTVYRGRAEDHGRFATRGQNCRLFYPPDPASLKNSSIGGNIATNAGGRAV
jgi:glycolate oxidase